MTPRRKDNARGQAGKVDKANGNQHRDHRPPPVTGQSAEVLELVQSHGSMLSLVLTADYAIREAAARIHDLRAMGYHIITTILPKVELKRSISDQSLTPLSS